MSGSLRERVKGLPWVRRIANRRYNGPVNRGSRRGALRAVVYLPTWMRWDVMQQRPHYVLREFARRGHPVYFVDPDSPRREVDGVTVVPDISETPVSGVILYTHYAPATIPAPLYTDSVMLYDITDDLTAFAEQEGERPPQDVLEAHQSLIEKATIVSAASVGLGEAYRVERPDLIVALNGVDIERFSSPAPRPSDMPPSEEERPVAGYHGAIAEWRFDFTLLDATARLLPDWDFVLVGPVDERVAGDVERLAKLPNVMFLGERSSESLAGYVQTFDVGTMWYPLNEVTTKALPMKVNEYLAASAPCVSTPLPSLVGMPGVWTADDADGYAQALVTARAARSLELSSAMARHVARSTWAVTLQPIFDVLEAAGLARVG